ncbi:molybdopterin molybdotransferase MoeA [Ensifer soli]|uniref:molybdopterin molybdotransferase MoeA n=1 Tax=Ciceribacter sp. sgz301302 TaxID=3342379 RepID=UPI0035BB3CCD
MALLPVEDALARLLSASRPVEAQEWLPLGAAQGRVLSADLAARRTHPGFDNAAMDGYAVRHQDIAAEGAELAVIGQSAAGHAYAGTIGPGQAVRIFTGAPVPAGADTVLMQEDAEPLDGARIRTTFVPEKGRHIRPSGQDFHEGDVVLAAGDALDAGRLTVAAAMNHALLPVFCRPRVAILATGDELRTPGSLPGADQIIASNSYGVAAIAREAGADVIDLGICGDDENAIADAAQRARGAGADVLVTLGGASVGDHDLVQAALTGIGMTLDFWRIAMRPGKPLMVGVLGGMQVLGLPGNPVSSLVCALLFLEPLVRRLGHLPPRDRMRASILAAPLAANDRRQDYVRARHVRLADGSRAVLPFGRQDSSMMQVFAKADCLIVRKPEAPAAEAGDTVAVLTLRESGEG